MKFLLGFVLGGACTFAVMVFHAKPQTVNAVKPEKTTTQQPFDPKKDFHPIPCGNQDGGKQ